jgi:hypothetical protein
VNRFAFLVLVGAIVAGSGAPAADPPKVSPRTDALDLLFIESEKPARLELRVEVDGKSVPAIWDETFAKLLTFFDRNADGSLDKGEAARLPSAFAVRQVLWGQISVFYGDPPAWAG